jgi:hypothetical protein
MKAESIVAYKAIAIIINDVENTNKNFRFTNMTCRYVGGIKTMDIQEPMTMFGSPVPLSFHAIYECVKDIDPMCRNEINVRDGG